LLLKLLRGVIMGVDEVSKSREEWKEMQEVRSIAEKALTLINHHEVVCAERYGALTLVISKNDPKEALKWVHIGMGICIAVNFFVGIFIAVHH